MLAFALQPAANAQTLFTTYDDWTNSSGSGSYTAGATTTFDYDGSTVDGLAGPNPGGTSAGGGGSLQISAVTSGWGPVAWVPGLNNQAGTAMDGPGWVQPYSAASGYGPGASEAASGTLLMDYTMPDNTFGGTYFQPAVWYNYPGNWGGWFATSETDLGPVNTPNGQMEMFQATIPYSINAVPLGSLWGFGIGIGANTDYSGANPWYVDSISIVPGSVTYTPEPGTIALIGVGLAGLFVVRRQRKS